MAKRGPHTPECPETGYACSTAHQRGCRCEACRAWNADYQSGKIPRRPKPPRCPVHGCALSTAYIKWECRCEDCVAAARSRTARWKAENPEKRRAYNARYRESHRKENAAYYRRYYRENREKKLEYGKAYSAKRRQTKEGREHIRGLQRSHRARMNARPDDEIRAAQDAVLPKCCPGCGLTKDREGWSPDRQRGDGLARVCKACHSANVQKRNAKKLDATPEWADEDRIRKVYAARDYMQGRYGGEWQVDHVVALARGGLHAAVNLQILTAYENASKMDTPESELDWTPDPAPLALLLWELETGWEPEQLTDVEAFELSDDYEEEA